MGLIVTASVEGWVHLKVPFLCAIILPSQKRIWTQIIFGYLIEKLFRQLLWVLYLGCTSCACLMNVDLRKIK